MRILYLDCFAGISGDMVVGALIDLGLDPQDLERELHKLPLGGYRLQIKKVNKAGLQATSFQVILTESGENRSADAGFMEIATPVLSAQPENAGMLPKAPRRDLIEILALIGQSQLSEGVKSSARAIFQRLGEAEAKVHGVPVEQVHFHEVGGVDAIIDIVSAAIGLEQLRIETVYASPLHLGSGFVKTMHGVLPVPAPATAQLLKGVPVYSSQVPGELVTPTGAAIITSQARGFGPLPAMVVEMVGYGAGSREREFPNVLRAYLGEHYPETSHTAARTTRSPFPQQHLAEAGPGGYHEGPVVVLEANIDDSSPQVFELLMEHLLEAGAMDVLLIPAYMKKNRPGILLQVLSAPDTVDRLMRIIFIESTTIGVRTYPATKHMLQREIGIVQTELGPIRIKMARLGDQIVNVTPEYEDCRALAIQYNLSLKEVYRLALKAGIDPASKAGGCDIE